MAVKPNRVDWFRIIADLKAHAAMDRTDIAKALERSEGIVRYWMAGGEPKHKDGEALCQLYRDKLGREPPRESQEIASA